MAPAAVTRPHSSANSYTPDSIISVPTITIAGLMYLSGIAGSQRLAEQLGVGRNPTAPRRASFMLSGNPAQKVF